MSDQALPTSFSDQVQQWQAAMAYISEKTSSLPVSQVVSSVRDWVDLMLDPALSPTMRGERISEWQQRFVRRWEVVAMNMLSGQAEAMSQQILLDPSTDITQGRKPYGPELAHAFWSAMVALQNDPPTVEAPDVLPQSEDLRTYVRMMAARRGQFYIPIISYAPLGEVEWKKIFEELPKMVEVTLAVEGVSLVWLLGTFVRNLEGRISLRPELNYGRPGPGTRLRPLRLILGTEYQKHGAWLGELSRTVEGRQPGLHDDLVAQIPLHRVTAQLLPAGDDYVPYNPENLSSVEKEISDRVFRAEREPREKPIIFAEAEPDEFTPPPPPTVEPEKLDVQEVEAPSVSSLQSPTLEDSVRDAEELRQKGLLALEENKALAKKYLLASTILDNSSVDVWMTLTQLASNEKEKAAFRREAQRVMQRDQT